MKSEIRNLLRLFSYHIICAYFVVSVSFAGQVEGGGGSIRCGGCGPMIALHVTYQDAILIYMVSQEGWLLGVECPFQ